MNFWCFCVLTSKDDLKLFADPSSKNQRVQGRLILFCDPSAVDENQVSPLNRFSQASSTPSLFFLCEAAVNPKFASHGKSSSRFDWPSPSAKTFFARKKKKKENPKISNKVPLRIPQQSFDFYKDEMVVFLGWVGA